MHFATGACLAVVRAAVPSWATMHVVSTTDSLGVGATDKLVMVNFTASVAIRASDFLGALHHRYDLERVSSSCFSAYLIQNNSENLNEELAHVTSHMY